jgi:hypothetical protein
MQTTNQVLKFNFFSLGAVAFLTMLFLFSCKKDSSDVATGGTEIASSNLSSAAHEKYGSVAVPFEATVFVPCANGGVGENVALSGTMNFVYQMTWTNNNFSMVFHDNSYGVTGLGLSSGETFAASSGTQGTAVGSWENSQWIGTGTRHLRIVGSNSTFSVDYNYRLIVTPDGNVTVSVWDQTSNCN